MTSETEGITADDVEETVADELLDVFATVPAHLVTTDVETEVTAISTAIAALLAFPPWRFRCTRTPTPDAPGRHWGSHRLRARCSHWLRSSDPNLGRCPLTLELDPRIVRVVVPVGVQGFPCGAILKPNR